MKKHSSSSGLTRSWNSVVVVTVVVVVIVSRSVCDNKTICKESLRVLEYNDNRFTSLTENHQD